MINRIQATCPNCEARLRHRDDPCSECDHDGGDPGCMCQHCEYVYAAERKDFAQESLSKRVQQATLLVFDLLQKKEITGDVATQLLAALDFHSAGESS